MRGVCLMGRLALAHRSATHDRRLPPLVLLVPLIERTENHWYWLGEFYDDGLDRSAQFRWVPENESPALFMVPRLLWQLANASKKKVRLENVCGLFTCINPEHWRDRHAASKIPARIMVPDTVDNVLVAHPNSVTTVHIRRSDSMNTLCCLRGTSCRVLDKASIVTCHRCIDVWVRGERPFTEVK